MIVSVLTAPRQLALALLLASAPAAAGKPEEVAVKVAGLRAVARSSSTLAGKPAGRYSVKNLFDGKLETAWVEGAKGDGKNEWMEVEFPEAVEVDGFLLAPGYGRSAEVFAANAAPLQVALTADGQKIGENVIRYAMLGDRLGCAPTGEAANFGPRVVVFERPVKGRRFRLAVKEDLRTSQRKYEDLAVSEWQLLLARRKGLPAVPEAWRAAVTFAVGLVTALRSETPEPRLFAPDARIRDLFAPYPGSEAASSHAVIVANVRGTGARPGAPAAENAWALLRGLVGAALALRTWEGRLQIVGEAVFTMGGEGGVLEYTPVVYAERESPTRIVETDGLVLRPLCGGQALPEPGRER